MLGFAAYAILEKTFVGKRQFGTQLRFAQTMSKHLLKHCHIYIYIYTYIHIVCFTLILIETFEFIFYSIKQIKNTNVRFELHHWKQTKLLDVQTIRNSMFVL